MIELTSREMVSQRNVAVEHRALDAPRVASPHRRSPVVFVILAAVLALTAVTIAERVEQRVIDAPVAATPVAATPVAAPSKAASSEALAAVAPAVVDAPLTSAVLPSGAMALTLRDGAATITTGLDAPAIELSTANIGDLDLGDVVDDAVIAQADDEVSYDWGDVTEWYRTVPEGIEHGYTIDSPVSDSDDLTVTVEVNDGTPTLVDADRVAISRPDAAPVWYRGLVAFDADGTDLPATLAVVDGAIELRVDTNGARYPVTIDPIVSAVVTFSTDVADSRLGFAVDVSGDRMVASAPFAGPAGFAGAGKVFVYERVDGVWVQTAVIQPATPEIDGRFGDAVALSPDGTRIAVGESDRLGDLAEPGRVFVFERQAGGVWNLLAGPVVAPAPAAGDGFGASVAWVGDDRLVIGAPFAAGRGAVYDYAVGGALTAVSPAFAVSPGDEFGFSVAVDERPEGGHRLIVGSPGWTGVSGQGVVFADLGAVTSYDDVDGLGFDALSGAILTSPLGPPVRLGGSVAVSGNRIAFGSSGGASITGTLYRTVDGGVNWIGETTVSLPKDPDTPDLSNRFVALQGDTLALGVPGGGGSVNLFRANGLVWPGSPSETVRPSGVELGDSFGWATALDGALLVTGAPGDDGPANALPDSGAVYTSRLSVTATFVDPAPFAPWNDPTNWDVGVVPSAGDAAVIPFGTYPELAVGDASAIDTLSVTGQLRIRGSLRVATSTTIATGATVDLPATGAFDPSGDLALDGELSNGGQVVVDGSASVTGIGRFINDGELRKTGSGTLTFGSGVVWTARFYSEVDVTGGNVEILGPLLDTNTQAIPETVTAGTFRVAAGTSLEFAGDLIVGPGTRFVTEITGPPPSPQNYGRIVVGNALGFDRTVPNPGPGLVGLEAVLNGLDLSETDVFPIITCTDCAADPGGDANGIEFDDFALSGLTAVQTRGTIELRTVANKIIASDPGIGLGTDVSVDGDWAVVGSRFGGPLRVYQFVAGDWLLTQSLENGTAERVAIDGNTIFADGIRYTRPGPGLPFVADQVIGGTTFDVDGRLVVRGLDEGVGNVVVSLIAGGSEALLVFPLEPYDYLRDVAIVDLGGGAAIAAVAAPAAPGGGRVYLFDLAVDEGLGTVLATARGFVSGGPDFGRSIAMSAEHLVVGSPLDGNPTAGAGAAWVYERTGPGATFTGDPTKLQALAPDVSDTLGDDVAIDGDVIVVGAPIAQKFNFPLRDGAAYVFQHNGTEWIETDILRAPDGFNDELFGDAVAVSGNRVLVGAPNDVNDNGPGAGAFYFYETTPPPPADPFAVTTTADAGPGSLREAVAAANAVSLTVDPDPITITFDIPGPGPHTIQPLSALPPIVRPMVIDGFSQPGSAPNTAAVDEAINAVIKIELSGALTPGGSVAGLVLSNGSSGSTIRGVAVNRFLGRAIQVSGAGGQTVSGNFIGVGPNGLSVGSAQQRGVDVYSSSNTIGGDTARDRNLISGNSSAGISVGASSAQNVIRGNFIGTDPTGTVAVPNGFAGVWLSGPDNIVGGVVPAQRNLISGNGRGVFVLNTTAIGNVIQGNWIGTDVTGAAPLPNGTGSPGHAGVAVQQDATGTLIGGINAGAGNLIASNNPIGVQVSGAGTTGTSILGNSITGSAGLGINVLDQAVPVPVVTSLVFDGVDLTVSGTVTGATDDYRVEIFANDVCDASGFGEGQYVLASFDLSSDDFVGGTAEFSTVVSAPVERSNITATATNSAGSTSTFSACLDVTTTVATFTNTAASALWDVAANWSTGAVPTAGEAAIVPAGTSPILPATTVTSIGKLTLGGTLTIDGRLDLTADSTVLPTGVLSVNRGGVLGVEADVTVDSGGQVVTLEGLPGGPQGGLIDAGDGASFSGGGLIANSGIASFLGSGVTPIGPGLTWTSGADSLIDIISGTVDIQTSAAAFSSQGIISVAPGAVLRSQSSFALADTSILEFGVDGPPSDDANYGRLELAGGTFAANGTVVTSPRSGYAPTGDSYPLISCTGGGCLGGTFDDVSGGVIDARTENEVRFVLVNTYVGPATSIAPGNWANPLGWSFGVVPGATDAAAIPAGRFVRVTAPGPLSVGSVTVAGDLSVLEQPSSPGVRFEILDDSVVTPTGRLFVGGSIDCTVDGIVTPVPPGFTEECVPSVTTLQLSANLQVDGNFSVATQVQANGIWQVQSNPVLELDAGASLSGSGTVLLFAQVVKSDPGTVTFGPGLDVNLPYNAGNDTRGVLEVTGGTLDIQSAAPTGSFTANGTIEIEPGATLSIADDLALSTSSVLEIGIDGPSSSVANYGRIVLPTGNLTVAGTLRAAIAAAYTPTAADRYAAITCGFCTGTFGLTETAPLDVVTRATSISLDVPAPPEPDEPVFGTFDFGASVSAVSVASSGIAASAIPSRNVSGSSGQSGSVASTSLSSIDLNTPIGANVAASPIASLTIGESVLTAVDVPSALDSLPLTDIDVTVPILGSNPPQVGGWEEILRQIGDPVLQARPLQNIRFGEVKGFPQVRALRLDQITLAGTPIASLPIASLVLGSTPIASLGTGIDWCAEIAATGSAANCATGIDPADTTLVELTLAGIPIASLPIASLPIASLPIASLPIASLPIASLDLAGTPIASLPIASLPIASLPIASLPIASLPIASLTVSGTPIASLPIASLPIASLPIASLPIASLPIASLPVAGTPIASLSPDGSLVSIPIASLDVTGTPIASLPIASLPIASLPIASLPIASLPIASLPIASLPIASLDVRGTPIASLTVDGTLATLPIASLPIASLPIASLPIASLPIASLPIASLPIASLPIASLPIASLPIASLPIASLPIASLPIASLPIASLPIASLPIASLPIASLPIASLQAVVDCTAIDCTSPDVSLAEALETALRPGVTFEMFAPLISGLRWSEVLPVLGLTEAEFAGILVNLKNPAGGTFTIGDALDFGDLTVGELPTVVLEQLFLGDLAPYLDGLRLSDLVDIIGPDGEFLDRAAVKAALTAAKNQLTATLGSVIDFDDLTLGDLVDENGDPALEGLTLRQLAPYLTGLRFDDLLGVFPGLTESQVRDAFADILANSSLELGDLLVGDATFADLFGSGAFGELTLGQLLTAILAENPNALDGITLGELLLAFVGPSDYPWDAIVFDQIDPADIPGVVGAVTFDADFELTGSTRGQSVDVTVTLPATASYLPGTAVFGGAPLAEPTVIGNVLTWRLSGLTSDTPYTLSFDLQPTLELGSSTVGVEARIVGAIDDAAAVVATSSVSVQQAFEPNDDPVTAKTLEEDTIYINHVASAEDLDFFQVDVTDGQRLVVNLSNLAADFDVVVYGRSESASIVPLVPSSGESAGAPTPDPIIEPGGITQVQTQLTGAATTFDGLPIVATGNRRGTESETVVTPPLEAGTVYVKVFGANGASSVRAAVLQAEITEGTTVPVCPALTSRFANGIVGTQTAIPSDANTLILVNQERLSALYPAGSIDPYTEVFDRLDDLVSFLNSPANDDLGIVPGIVDVGRIAGIASDYAAWDAEPCDSAKANGVVAEIADEITSLRQTRDIEHILVVGGDDIVPYARVTDGAEVSNEFDYRFTFSGNNAIAGSAWDRQILTDEPYGETAALDYGDRFLYITDTALGRLVDTPSEIAFQLEQFVTAQGRLNPTTGLVVGYDFLDDGSEAIAADLEAALGAGNVDDEFGSSTDTDDWTAGDLADKLFPIAGTTPDVISLNAHFDHRRALPALGNSIDDESDLFEATAVFNAAPGSLTGRVTFSMGCHSGLAISDATIGVLSDDFAQAFTGQGGVYVGNTGFGYGDTETVAYSERLMELFGEELLNPILLDRPTTAGQALQFAKNTFFSELGNVSVYDEKALMESTFYGVPFYRVTLEPEAPEPTPTTTTQIDPITGDPVATFTITPDHEVLGTTDGTKYVNRNASGDPLELKSPFNPAQPLELIDVTVVDPTDPTNLDLVARGAIVTGLNSTYISPVDPVIVRPVADDSATQPEPEVSDVVFPVRPAAIRTTSQAEGERQTLALATGQFRGSSTAGVQRLDNELNAVVYYAETSETDFTAPLVGAVNSFVIEGALSISVDVGDTGGVGDAGTDIDRVYVLVGENPGVGTVEWRGVELAEDQTTAGRWVGSLLLSPDTDDVQLFVQAKDGAGNVGVSSNKGENFAALDVEEPSDPPADVEVEINATPSADVANAVWFDAPVTVTVTADGLPVEYRLRNGPITPFPSGGLVIDAEGASRLVISVGGGEVVDRVIRIDRADPTVQITSPIDASTPAAGDPLQASFTCSDAALVSCDATLDGIPVVVNADLSGLDPGPHTLTVTAIDAAGNGTTKSSTFTVVLVQEAPEITLVDGPRTPQLITDGFMVDIEFTDGNLDRDDYTVTIDWGDGDADTPGTSTTCGTSTTGTPTAGNPSCEILTSPSADGPGLAVGNFEYAKPGVYAITVRVTDGTDSSTSVFQFATIYDPDAGRVSGAGSYWSGPEAYDGGRWGAPAFFGYNARYQGADPEPRGQTKLHLIGEFFFKSTSYDYLIINDTLAVAQGTGTFNGRSGYDFRVQGIDNGWLDFFQLTIWDAAGSVVYDNGVKYDDGQLVEADEGDRVLLGGIRILR